MVLRTYIGASEIDLSAMSVLLIDYNGDRVKIQASPKKDRKLPAARCKDPIRDRNPLASSQSSLEMYTESLIAASVLIYRAMRVP